MSNGAGKSAPILLYLPVMKFITGILVFSIALNANSQIAEPGKPLPAWKEGYLDLHHINTGRGSSAYYIFPDGTTMLFDAGEMSPESQRVMSPRNSVIRPNDSKRPYEWIAHYIKQVAPDKNKVRLDYAAISHFHDDHFGSWYRSAPKSSSGKYILSGITGVGELIPISNMLDRGYPEYNYPVSEEILLRKIPVRDSSYGKGFQNYRQFISVQQSKGMKPAMLRAGSRSQVAMLYKPKQFPDFFVQNVKANGLIWTGNDSSVQQHFPPIDTSNVKTWPDENSLSLAFTINYGPFIYYSGGDNPGNVFYGDAAWRDVETPISRAVGEVDVATLDHHGNRDAVNEFQVKTFKPRVWIGQSWSSDHPGHEVLIRMTTPYLYSEERDIFATNMLEANRVVIGPLIDRSYKSQQGHIVVRVMPGGKNYYVIILDDSKPEMPVKKVFGPYTSKKSSKLIGHRGGVVDSSYTENSMPALETAVKRGYYMVETDVRLTKDNQLIATTAACRYNRAQQNNILVVPSINKFHYTDIPYMQDADRDITQLKKWGVEFYQIDSEFDKWLR